jgi:glutamate/tyrosine decarboxylase-like PLP-dependent enzyme
MTARDDVGEVDAQPDAAQIERTLFLTAAARGADYLAHVRERRVAPTRADIDALRDLGGPCPETGMDAAAVLELLDRMGSPATVANSGGRYFGFVNGGAVPAARAAMVLAAAWDQNVCLRVMSPVGATLEDICLEWLCDLLSLPRNCAGALVTGATMANVVCLASARHALLARAGWDVEADGLFGAPPLTVVVGEEAHASVSKALALLGFGRDRVMRAPADAQGRIRPESLPPLDGSTIVCVQAGNVNTGAFDPFPAICSAAAESGAWVHVDGAFGLWAGAAPDKAYLVTGADRAHSWATDAHKWLNVPYDCGVALVRHGDALRDAMHTQAPYLMAQAAREPMHWGPDMSRRARGVEVWAALRSLGRSGVRRLIERTCEHARRFADGLAAASYTVLNDVVLNQVLVAFDDDGHTARVIRAVQEDGTCWCGGTTWQGRAAMRISVSSWATTAADVDLSLDAILRLAQETR